MFRTPCRISDGRSPEILLLTAEKDFSQTEDHFDFYRIRMMIALFLPVRRTAFP